MIDINSLPGIPANTGNLADVSQFGAFGRGALSMLPLGKQAYAGVASAAQNEPYPQERQELEQEIGQDKEQAPAAHYAGQAAGVIAPIVATSGLAAPETLLGAVGQGAGIGGAFGAGNAIDTLAGGGSKEKAAEDVALGAGLGAAGGAAGKGLGSLLAGLGRKAAVSASRVADAGEPLEASIAKGAEPIADARQAPNLTPEDLVSIEKEGAGAPLPGPASIPPSAQATASPTPETPPTIQAKQGFFPSAEELRAEVLAGQLGGSPRQIRALPGKDIVASLNHMGDVIRANSTPDNPLIGMTDRYSSRLQKFVNLQNSSGKTIGDTIENAGVPPVPIQPIADNLINSSKFLNPADQAQLQSVIDQVGKYAKLDGTPGAINFNRLQQLKGDLGDVAFKGQGNPVLQNAYHVISDTQDNELEKLGTSINKPAFTQAKEAYQMTSRAIPMLRMATARSLAKGYSAYGAPLAALVTGHPVAALGSLLKEPLQRAAGAAAFGAPEIGETLGAVPSAVGAQAAKMAPDAASDASRQQAVQHFIMSQRSPAAAKQASEAAADARENPAIEKPQNMATGGVVDAASQQGDKPLLSQIKDALLSTQPVPDSTLDGLQNVADEEVSPKPIVPTAPVVRSAIPQGQMHQSFNPQMAEQLRAYLLGLKEKENDNE